MKVLVTGSRNWTDYKMIYDALVLYKATFVVNGKASGADKLSTKAAIELGIKYQEHPADWDTYGNAAGPVRNGQMLTEHPDIDLVLAFHDDLKNAKGTGDMVRKSIKANLRVIHYYHQTASIVLNE